MITSTRVRAWALALGLVAAASCTASSGLARKTWIHGAEDCRAGTDPPIEVFEADPSTYVLRQNKCIHFEAPFIYVLFGDHTVLVQDTGATADPERFPLFATVGRLVEERQRHAGAPLKVLVVHSHGHSDHTAADAQFRGQPSVTMVEAAPGAARRHFQLDRWPEGRATLDLGGRAVAVFPVPGHHEDHIAIHDPKTGWLLTGDTLYPGRLVVRDWAAFRASIARLAEFTRSHAVTALVGSHIEMSAAGELFRGGETHQPGEAPLPLEVSDLLELDARLRKADEPARIRMPRFEVVPIGGLQRALGDLLRGLGAR